MPWADTSSGIFKQRNAANSGWINLFTLSSGNLAQLGGMTLTGEINTKRTTVAATATTTPLWAAGTGNVQDWTGTPTITNLPAAPQAGASRTVYPAAGTTFTDNANIDVEGDANYTIVAGDRVEIEALTTTTFKVWIKKKSGVSVARSFKLPNVDATVAANALTITINPGTWDFRSTTLTDGTPTTLTLSSPITVVVPNTATLGMVDGVAARLAIIVINNAGTLEAAVVNLAGGNQLDETNLITTTTISTGADSNNVIYSTTGRTGVAYRVAGFLDITQAAIGVWASNPTLVQPAGGQALTALSSIGYGQTWQDVSGSRSIGTTYYNTTGKPIALHFRLVTTTAAACTAQITIGGVALTGDTITTSGAAVHISQIIPPGASYLVTISGSGNVAQWLELR
jgi:hypothetical protein